MERIFVFKNLSLRVSHQYDTGVRYDEDGNCLPNEDYVLITTPNLLDIPPDVRRKFVDRFNTVESLYQGRFWTLKQLNTGDEDTDHYFMTLHEFFTKGLLDIVLEKVIKFEEQTPSVYTIQRPPNDTMYSFLNYADYLTSYKEQCESGISESEQWDENDMVPYKTLLEELYLRVRGWLNDNLHDTPTHEVLSVELHDGVVTTNQYFSHFQEIMTWRGQTNNMVEDPCD